MKRPLHKPTSLNGRTSRPVATVRVGPLAPIPSLLREFGCEPAATFAGTGLELRQFADPDNELPYLAASRLLARCVADTRCPHFGLLLGQATKPSALGLPGFILRTAANVRGALQALVQHLDLHDQGGSVVLVSRPDFTFFGYDIHEPGAAATDQIYDLSIAVACNIMRDLCGQQWSPSEVVLAHRQPRDVRPYKEFFHAPIRFDADQSGLSFATYWLDRPVSGADPALHRHLAQEADDLKRQREDGFVERLRRSIRLALANGECVAAEVAQGLGMHERTLNRRLRSEGTNFRREVAHVRYEAARQLLADTQLPVSRIAAALGYGDTTAFARAFKAWSGAAPATWRREHEQAE